MLLGRRAASLDLEDMVGTDDLLSKFDVEDIATEALLFQTGYLTIAEEKNLNGKTLYRLSYPNREVKQSLNEHLLRALGPDPSRQGAHDIRLYDLLTANDFAGLESAVSCVLRQHPLRVEYTRNDIANYEGYYASVFYSWFAASGLDTTVEDSSSHGRLDMAVRFAGNVYLFEFKVIEIRGAGSGNGATQEQALRGQVPEPGRADPSGRRGVQQ